VQLDATQVPSAWAAAFPDDCRVFAHAGFPEQLASNWLHATSSAQAVTELQHADPRHASHAP
jgi:hypothetical protein